MECTQLFGAHISSDITNRNVTSIIDKFYANINRILYVFRNVPCHVKAKLLSTYCLDLYGSELWSYSSIAVQSLCSVEAKLIEVEKCDHHALVNVLQNLKTAIL